MAEKGMSLRKQAFAPWGPRRQTRYVKIQELIFNEVYYRDLFHLRTAEVSHCEVFWEFGLWCVNVSPVE